MDLTRMLNDSGGDRNNGGRKPPPPLPTAPQPSVSHASRPPNGDPRAAGLGYTYGPPNTIVTAAHSQPSYHPDYGPPPHVASSAANVQIAPQDYPPRQPGSSQPYPLHPSQSQYAPRQMPSAASYDSRGPPPPTSGPPPPNPVYRGPPHGHPAPPDGYYTPPGGHPHSQYPPGPGPQQPPQSQRSLSVGSQHQHPDHSYQRGYSGPALSIPGPGQQRASYSQTSPQTPGSSGPPGQQHQPPHPSQYSQHQRSQSTVSNQTPTPTSAHSQHASYGFPQQSSPQMAHSQGPPPPGPYGRTILHSATLQHPSGSGPGGPSPNGPAMDGRSASFAHPSNPYVTQGPGQPTTAPTTSARPRRRSGSSPGPPPPSTTYYQLPSQQPSKQRQQNQPMQQQQMQQQQMPGDMDRQQFYGADQRWLHPQAPGPGQEPEPYRNHAPGPPSSQHPPPMQIQTQRPQYPPQHFSQLQPPTVQQQPPPQNSASVQPPPAPPSQHPLTVLPRQQGSPHLKPLPAPQIARDPPQKSTPTTPQKDATPPGLQAQNQGRQPHVSDARCQTSLSSEVASRNNSISGSNTLDQPRHSRVPANLTEDLKAELERELEVEKAATTEQSIRPLSVVSDHIPVSKSERPEARKPLSAPPAGILLPLPLPGNNLPLPSAAPTAGITLSPAAQPSPTVSKSIAASKDADNNINTPPPNGKPPALVKSNSSKANTPVIENAVTPAKRKSSDDTMIDIDSTKRRDLKHTPDRQVTLNGGNLRKTARDPASGTSLVTNKKRKVHHTEPPVWARKTPGKDAPLAHANFQLRKPKKHAAPPSTSVPVSTGRNSPGHRHSASHGSPPSGPIPAMIRGQQFLGPWEPCLSNMRRISGIASVVADFVFTNVVRFPDAFGLAQHGILFEVEAKLGTLIDKDTNERVNPLVASECVLHDSPRIAFRSEMTENHHRVYNKVLNEICMRSCSAGRPARVPVVYKHLREIDRYYELSRGVIQRLPSPVQDLITQQKFAPKLRVTLDQKDPSKVLAKIIKLRVGDKSIWFPSSPLDCRVSINLEINVRESLEELGLGISEGSSHNMQRGKDRLSYAQGPYQIDLTQVTTVQGSRQEKKEHELEVELNSNTILDQGRLAMSGGQHGYEALIEGFVENIRMLAQSPNDIAR